MSRVPNPGSAPVPGTQGVAVGPLSGFADRSATRVGVDGIEVALVRIGDDVYAIGDTCSHAKVSLSEGEVWCDELELECPRHGSAFSLLTGEPNSLPATQPVGVYRASVVDDVVYLAFGPDDTDPTAGESI